MNTTFEHNGPVQNILKTFYGKFVIHSGGLSIGTNILDERSIGLDTPSIVITHCTFVNNSAFPNDDVQQSPTQVFINSLFNGRGGGLGVVLNSTFHSYSVNVSDCFFIGNRAKLLGGGMYFTIGPGTSHVIMLDHNVIMENESDFAGGGTFIGSIGPGTPNIFNKFIFNDCLYNGNIAERGGGAAYAVASDQGQLL